jgi:hypothetical protein
MHPVGDRKMSVMGIEDPEVSFERYHDRYMATLRG